MSLFQFLFGRFSRTTAGPPPERVSLAIAHLERVTERAQGSGFGYRPRLSASLVSDISTVLAELAALGWEVE